jgi:TRAP-type C4-dicarboxylate transport system permease small subunit
VSAVLRTLLKADEALHRVCLGAALVCLGLLVVVVGAQVVARYVFAAPPSWTDELARWLMVWSGLLGATVAFRRGVDPVIVKSEALPGRWLKRIAGWGAAAAVLIFLLPIAVHSFVGPGGSVARSFLARNAARTSEGMEVSMLFVASAVPLAAVVILFHLAVRVLTPRPRDGGAP